MNGNLFQLLLQLAFLLVLYLFVARAIRAILLDVYGPRTGRPAKRPRGRPQAAAVPSRPSRQTPSQLVINDLNGQRSLPVDESSSVTLGRAAACDLVVADNYVSNMHARIYGQNGTFMVEDMGSTNGTYVNNRRLTAPVVLAPGDEVRVGKATLELRR